MIFEYFFDAKMERLEIQKQAFRIIRFAKYEVSVFREKASKMLGQKESQTDYPNLALGAQGSDF